MVVLPSQRSSVRASVIAELRSLGATVLDVDLPSAAAAPLAVRTCAAIVTARPTSPLLVVALSDGAELVASVALSQRTAHRAVTGYVLIDPETDPSAPDWPDAPVLAIVTEAEGDAARRARLRGWQVAAATAPAVIAGLVRAQI